MDDLRVLKADGTEGTLSQEAVGSLATSIRGETITTRDPAYDQSRRLWNGMIDRRPALIVRCSGVADVISCIRFVGKHGLRVSVRGGGHNVAGNAVCDGGLVIDLSKMRAVSVDVPSRTAKAQGGALLGDLDHEAQAFGLATPVGVMSVTGVAGLTLHGGMGWLLRRHGLSADNLISAEVVTADGTLRRASLEENPDLLWALRGAGGNFGVVTSFEFRLHPVGPLVWVAIPLYPMDAAADVLKAFRTQMAAAPDDLSAIAVFWTAPEAPGVPEDVQRKPVLVIAGCYAGPPEKGEQAVDPLRKFAQPLADLSGPMRYLDAQRLFDSDYPNGRRYYWKSTFINALTDEVIETLASGARRRPSPLSSVDVWALGGAFARANRLETCFGNRDAPFLVAIEANWEKPDDDKTNIAWARQVLDEVRRDSQARVYLNFPGFAEEGEDLMKAAFGENYRRLQAVKAKYDPGNLFRSTLNIRPST